MTSTLADYINAGKALAPDDRLEAARQLLLSIDHDAGSDPSIIRAEWDDVVDRRVEEVLRGQAELVDGRAAHARLRAELAASRE